MKIEFTKTGLFSFHPVYGPVQACKKGEVIELEQEHAKQLIKANWAIEKVKNAVQPKEEKRDIIPPWEKPDWDKDAEDAKQQLIDYSNERFNYMVDKRRAVSTLLRELKRKLINAR